jgi:uncharacterized protein
METKKIAIIGGGVSGLSTAYFLLSQSSNENVQYEVQIYESTERIGGNAHTLPINLFPKSNDAKYTRWADMGVNDFNMTSYKKTVELMKNVGYIIDEDDYFSKYALEDTCAYGNLDGSVTFTDDGDYNTETPPQILKDNDRFKIEAPKDVTNIHYKYYSVERYVLEKGYSQEFINDYLYARINGMYFCNGAPSEVPFLAVMHYYILQEGYNAKSTPTPKRCYFKGGSSAWIEMLYQKIIALSGNENIVLYNQNINVEVGCYHGKPLCIYDLNAASPQDPIYFDYIIMANHADDAFHTFNLPNLLPDPLKRILSAFTYAPSTSVCHSDARVFQPNKNSWRTYNIHVYDFQNDLYGPYTINYVENRHQNDKSNAAYNTSDYPQMFVSLNPAVFPNEKNIFDSNGINNQAKAKFKHQKLSLASLIAQDDLVKVQGLNNIYFCNGYALGAGLHEECIILANQLCDKINKPINAEHIYYDEHHPTAPDYIHNSVFQNY